MRSRRREQSPSERERVRRLRREHRREGRRRLDVLRAARGGAWFGGIGIVLGALVGLAGGSATFAWTIGTAGGWLLGFSLLLPFVARQARLSWWLVGIAACTALSGGIAYLLAPSDVTWWLGQLTGVPALALYAYFHEPESANGRHFDTTSGEVWAPPDGGGGGDGG